MSLKVKELLQLQSLRGMKLVSGAAGMNRTVSSAGIADYEFAPGIEYENSQPFEQDSFVISSLLFARGDEKRILEAVKKLYEAGTAALAFKTIIFEQLPEEVLRFSDKAGYPIFSFGTDVYFENIIYETMYAVQRDDTITLGEEHIKRMIAGEMSRGEVEKISSSISLVFRSCAMAVYVRPREGERELDTVRICRSLYMNKSLKKKCILCEYNKGLFIILTGAFDEEQRFEVILKEALEDLSLSEADLTVARSGVYRPYENLDRCIRESYFAYLAGAVSGKDYGRYREIGTFKFLAPLKDNYAFRQFSEDIMENLADKEEYFQTVLLFVRNSGSLADTASAAGCHQNTVRYRLSKVREMIGAEAETDFELYCQLAAAVRIYLLNRTDA